jgi:hypothetical protein
MATTTNYGWTTPDDTALVKDGAAAIRTFGTSVDTTTKNLNPETTLGDIAYRSSTANVKTRLGIGTTGQVLAVSGGVPAWTTPSSGSLTLITTATAADTSGTLSVNNCFSATYDNYLIISDMKVSAESNYILRLRVSGSDASTLYYLSGFYNSSASSTLQAFNHANVSDYKLRDIGTDKGVHSIVVSNPYNAIDTSFTMQGLQGWQGTSSELVVNGGIHHSATSYTGFSLLADNGNLTGTVRVYGYSNS